jgi:hypothetical protein
MREQMTDRPQLSLWGTLLLLISSLFLHGCVLANPLMYAATSTEAWVKDADTGQPLEGVIVVAQWELRGGLHPDAVGSLMVMETVTDASGHFTFSAWGPRVAPLGTYIGAGDPHLFFFKSDYDPAYLSNKVRSTIDRSLLRHSEWDGKTIPLKKFTGSLEEYAKRVGSLDDSLEFFAFRYQDCSWKQIPRMLVALHLEHKKFIEQGLRDSSDYPSSIENRDSSYRVSHAKCGSIKEFLRSYLP